MGEGKIPRISTRKQPKQARSAGLVEAILEAAVQVLRSEGAARFTTARVAERAGVSVGSLYQYFPNKAAILFRLQSDEWRQTVALLSGILQDQDHAPSQRLRRLVQAFIQSECDEAAVRQALSDAAPLYRDAPEAKEAKAAGAEAFYRLIEEALPGLPANESRLAAGVIKTSLSAAGQQFSETPRGPEEIAAYADALADMFCAYLDALAARRESAGSRE